MSEDHGASAATKLTRTEFAVVRAYAQGMRPVDIANRYLSDPDDDDVLTEHQAIARILGLRDRLVQFALQHDRPEIAEMFEALRGRSDVGMTRRVDALSSLEGLGQGRPSSGHEVGLWFGPNLARRLTAAGIHKISDLAGLANARGSSWWRAVPRIGPKSAEVITRWLIAQRDPQKDNNKALIGTYIIAPSEASRRPTMVPLPLGPQMAYPVPLELMLPPLATRASPDAGQSDLELVRQWLDAKPRSPHTRTSYRKEAERLLLWLAREQLRLAEITGESLRTYAAFLQAPEPAAFWCGPASPRDRVHWRPFEGPLGVSSRTAALRVVRALLTWLSKAGFIEGNVNVVDAAAVDVASGESDGRGVLSRSDIDGFLDWLGKQEEAKWQAAFAAGLLIRDGFRLSELAGISCEGLQIDAAEDCLQWNGPKARPRVIAPDTLASLRKHWVRRGLTASPPSGAALLGPTDYPPTRRGAAKRLAGHGAGYGASGLDQLLRAAWKAYVRTRAMTLPAFTPRQIRSAAA
ncbi:phage integrase family protein [Cupriavidus sp. WKF15]|uniref:phage integrase family protein n=1 Tax=Cupriavidus sp. WKF15 TaxID=3032282 RepID=UPI0023E327C9|nr:phage integrase family protein [Cupriavidus sp. WKF15]WER49552.1 phage integrase family protein [Cupriavidus sp. WKF15]